MAVPFFGTAIVSLSKNLSEILGHSQSESFSQQGASLCFVSVRKKSGGVKRNSAVKIRQGVFAELFACEVYHHAVYPVEAVYPAALKRKYGGFSAKKFMHKRGRYPALSDARIILRPLWAKRRGTSLNAPCRTTSEIKFADIRCAALLDRLYLMRVLIAAKPVCFIIFVIGILNKLYNHLYPPRFFEASIIFNFPIVKRRDTCYNIVVFRAG